MAAWKRVVGAVLLVQAVALALFGLHSQGVVQLSTRSAPSTDAGLDESLARQLGGGDGKKNQKKGNNAKRGNKGSMGSMGERIKKATGAAKKALEAAKKKKEATDKKNKDGKKKTEDGKGGGNKKGAKKGGAFENAKKAMKKGKATIARVKKAMAAATKKGKEAMDKKKKDGKKNPESGDQKNGKKQDGKGKKDAMEGLRCTQAKVKGAMKDAEAAKKEGMTEADFKKVVKRFAGEAADGKCNAGQTMRAMMAAWKKSAMEQGKQAMALLKQCNMEKVKGAMERFEAKKETVTNEKDRKELISSFAEAAADNKCNAEKTAKAMMVAWEMGKKAMGGAKQGNKKDGAQGANGDEDEDSKKGAKQGDKKRRGPSFRR